MIEELIERDKIKKSVIDLFKVNMCLKENERALILTDIPTIHEWQTNDYPTLFEMIRRTFLAKMASEIAAESFPDNDIQFYPYPSTGRSGSELSEEVASKMRSSETVVGITTHSLTHTSARQKATEAGVRVASMPSFEPEMFYPGGPMNVDYRRISEETNAMAEQMSTADKVHITAEAGTDISFNIKDRKTWAETGVLTQDAKMKVCNLPAGEASVSPIEGTTEGTIVAESGWYPGLREKMTIIVRNGSIAEIQGGGQVGQNLTDLLKPGNTGEPYVLRSNIAEFGVGSNPNAKKPDNLLEAEKIKGTIHIGMGSNFFLGGKIKADYHSDIVVPLPDVSFDGKLVIKKGNWQIS